MSELRSEDPMMPFLIWKNRSILSANIVSHATGVLLIGISSYLPAFVTGVMEKSARCCRIHIDSYVDWVANFSSSSRSFTN